VRKTALKTYIIGRSRFADIKVPHTSVAPRHAELVVTDNHRYHLTDCATSGGTWRRASGNDDRWNAVRQAFVTADEGIRFGNHVCTIRELLRQVEATETADGLGRWRTGPIPEKAAERVRGRVERDPVTGEIVRKRV
jgi:pSer/pThr/pTyr-binding forkhead associated (FHA) protein